MKKYYAVKQGIKPGIYTNWKECERQVKGVKGCIFKGFNTIEAAEEFMCKHIPKKKPKCKKQKASKNVAQFPTTNNKTTEIIAYVDGSYNTKDNVYGYGVVLLCDNAKITLSGNGNNAEKLLLRNVAGELDGAIRAIGEALLLNPLPKKITLYYDYEGIEKWVTGEWTAKQLCTQQYVAIVQQYKEKINVDFVKVTAHSKIELNEEADKLAKRAVGIL